MKDDKSDPVAYSIVTTLLSGVISLAVAIFIGFQLPPLDINLIFYLVVSVLWGLGIILYFKAFQLLESSEVVILGSFRSLITIAVSIVFLSAAFTGQMLLGTILILGSIFLITNLKEGLKFNKGVLYAFAMAFFCGLAVVFDSVNLKNIDPISYLAIINFLIGILILLAFPKKIKQIKIFKDRTFLKKILLLCVFNTAQAVAYYFALSIGPAAQIAPIGQSQIIITIILGALILRERDHLARKIIAGILVMIGVLLLK